MENNKENRYKLAQEITDSCDIHSLMDSYFNDQYEYLKDVDDEEFNELWKQYLE